MPKKFSQDSVILYAEARGISPNAARMRRNRGHADFLKWEEERRAVGVSKKKKKAATVPPVTGDLSLTRYMELENKTHSQLLLMQQKLDEALADSSPAEVRICSQALKDVASLYNDVVSLRKQAEVSAALLLPIEVLDRYKSTFYPRLEKGVEEMRMHIEAFLPEHMRADFITAWRSAYPKYQTAAREAESAIESVREEARKAKIKK